LEQEAPMQDMIDWSKGAGWIKGRIVPIAEATIGVTDWGVTRSDITYDVVPVRDGAFFRLEDYLDRFEASMASMRMDVGMTRDDMRAALHAMVARSGLRAAYVAMVASRGVPLVPGTRDPRTCANHFYAWCVPYIHVVPLEVAAQGASVWIAKEVRRIPEDSVNPRAKNYHWGDLTQGLFEAKDRGFETVVLLDHAGNVTEGPGFNIFAVKGGRVITPDRSVLHGITRRTVLEICAEQGIAAETRALPLAEFLEADEVFLSTSGGGAVPVIRVDDRIFSNGAPGPVAAGIRDGYWDWMERGEHRQPVVYVDA
jgi:branched-chain amino acid aminotransferase